MQYNQKYEDLLFDALEKENTDMISKIVDGKKEALDDERFARRSRRRRRFKESAELDAKDFKSPEEDRRDKKSFFLEEEDEEEQNFDDAFDKVKDEVTGYVSHKEFDNIKVTTKDKEIKVNSNLTLNNMTAKLVITARYQDKKDEWKIMHRVKDQDGTVIAKLDSTAKTDKLSNEFNRLMKHSTGKPAAEEVAATSVSAGGVDMAKDAGLNRFVTLKRKGFTGGPFG